MTDKESIKVLMIEDDQGDAQFIRETLLGVKSVRIDIEHAVRLAAAIDCLAAKAYDVVLLDLSLPDSQGIETFHTLHSEYPDTPVIILTGLSDEDLATNAVQRGAQDYLLKGQVEGRQLVRAMQYSIERQRLFAKIEKSLKEIKTLRGLIPMCSWCGKIRDDKGYWTRVETYIAEHTEATFTHGICAECVEKIDPGMLADRQREDREISDSDTGKPLDQLDLVIGHLRVLLLEDDPGDAGLIRALLSEAEGVSIDVEVFERFSSGVAHLGREKFDVILSDLGLPDSQGLETFIKMHTFYPDIPVIVLTGSSDEELAFRAVRSGAQDYLVKGEIDGKSLLKSIRYAVERQKLLGELENMIWGIKRLEKERKRILSTFAHDIRNAIIPSISFLGRILSGKALTPEADLALIREELVTANHLLTNFIEFSRFEAKEYKPILGQFDLEDALHKLVESWRMKAKQKDIKIIFERPEKPLPLVAADGAMIQRVISNLLDNAVKYTNSGGTIDVRVLNLENNVLVEVKDTGIGIPEVHIPHIFDAFYRVPGDLHGSGLGLSIARTIIEAHGGEIWAESLAGKESTFSFSLPKQ
jgi:signal transduction histidine kinase